MELGPTGEVIVGYLVALAAGALIGIERERHASREPALGGVRTYPLIALSGALSAMFSNALGPAPLVGGLGAVALVLVVFYARVATREEAGITSEIAALTTFLLGALALLHDIGLTPRQRYLTVMAGAAVVMGLLSYKEPLHALARRVTTDELYATAKLAIFAAVALPLLPNASYGPWGALNPFRIGLFVLLVAGVGFVGYLAIRLWGERRGYLMTGIIGGLVSSTAVTLGLSQRTRDKPEIAASAAVAIIAAGSTMFLRVIVIVAVVDPELALGIGWSFAATALAGFLGAALVYKNAPARDEKHDAIEVRNPFALKPALAFGALFAVIMLGVRAAQHYIGRSGIYASGVIAGTTDVDAISLSLAEMHKGGLETTAAAVTIGLASLTNTLVKMGVALSVGGRGLGRKVAMALGGALLVGLVVLVLTR